jgi:hypothetical protein
MDPMALHLKGSNLVEIGVPRSYFGLEAAEDLVSDQILQQMWVQVKRHSKNFAP